MEQQFGNMPTNNDVLRQLASIDLDDFGLTVDDITSDISVTGTGAGRTLNIVVNVPSEYMKDMSEDKLRSLQGKINATLQAIGGDIQVAVILSTHSNIVTPKLKPKPIVKLAHKKKEKRPKVAPVVKPKPKKPFNIKNIIAVASGKGGVGKSLVSVNLALALAYHYGLKVGVLDADVHGPSVSHMMGINGKREMTEGGLVRPQERHGISTMSIGYMIDEGQPAIWRGPMINKALHHMAYDVDWSGLDVLLVDTPPGTGDVQLSLNSLLDLDGAVIVSTPQQLALNDARRGIGLFQKMDVPVFGLVENMSEPTFSHIPNANPISEPNFFGEGGAEAEAKNQGIDFLGKIPFDHEWTKSSDAGVPILASKPDDPKANPFKQMAKKLAPRLII